MGIYVFKLPDVGEGIAEAEIVAWHVAVGEDVKEDQPLVDVMTEKATVEIGAPVSGKLLSRKGEAGDMVPIGNELVTIAIEEKAKGPASVPVVSLSLPPAPPDVSKQVETLVRLVRVSHPSSMSKPTAPPAVRARAVALGIDLAAIAGSGPEGRIRHEDLDAVLVARRGGGAGPAAAPRDGIEEIRVIGLRRQIAETMQAAKRRIPHFSYVEEVDVSALEALRQDLNERRAEGSAKLTLLPFLIRALVRTLPDQPGINAHFDDEAGVIRRHAAIHVGVATQTRRGLLVPVIRHAETLDLSGIAAEIARLSEAARAGKASREELSGSTITVSSLGALGGIAATPIIKPPEVAVVAVNRIVERAVVRDGQIVIRKMMNLSSSFDHRVVDGFDAASFIQGMRGYLEMPARLFIETATAPPLPPLRR
jgi:2-oxoisovalerate dehydrogenase E2 component (dihydrolipoyl transacylase)